MASKHDSHNTNYVQLAELKLLFDSGVLREALITSEPMATGYHLEFHGPKALYYFSGQRDEYQRVFKSIDAAMASARAVGFHRARIELS